MYRTIVQLFDERVKENPSAYIQMGKNEKGAFIPKTLIQLQEESRAIAAYLRSHGVKRGDNIGIISDNRPEWLAADLGILALGCADVPRGRDSMPYEVKHILSVTDAAVAFAENKDQCDKILSLRAELPALKMIILIEGEEESRDGVDVVRYCDAVNEGIQLLDNGMRSDIEHQIALGGEDETATIIFTSGTTGLPKGVMLTHRNMIYQLGEIDKIIDFKPGWKWLSVLPVWHSFERIIQYVAIYERSILAYSKPIGKIMLTDLVRINPELMCSVPRIWETVKAGVNQMLKQKKPFEQKAFAFLLAAAKKYRKAEDMVFGLNPRFSRTPAVFEKIVGFIPYVFLGLIYKIGDKMAFRQIKEKFGTSFIAGISGGGSMPKDVDEFFNAIGVKLLNGYGMTETAPVIGVQTYPRSERGFMHPFLGTELRVASTEDGHILKPGEKGELLVRGPQIMKGYYKDPERTARIIDKEGFLHTGDIGRLVDGKYLQITDRKKEIFKLSLGKYVAPQVIENMLKESPYIQNCFVIGENQKFASAIIIPDFEHLHHWAKESGLGELDNHQLAADPKAVTFLHSIVEQTNSKLAPHEHIKRERIVCDEWTPSNGLLSQTLKLKRAKLTSRYSGIISEIYR